jgi:hypothetical protein
MNERIEELSRLQYDREYAALREEKEAKISARFVHMRRGNYRLKIANVGKSAARNLDLEFPEGNDIFLRQSLSEKLPFNSLKPGH